MHYQPKPTGTSGVALSSEIEKLTELLASNAYNIWAHRRFADGWTYGPKRDDNRKTHPCVVPHEELPESENEYDRHPAMDTLPRIVALG